MVVNYKNESYTDFTLEINKAKMETALSVVDSQKGKDYPLIVGGKKINTDAKITSINPSKIKEIIGTAACADTEIAEEAIQCSLEAFATWKEVSPRQRASYLFKAAAILRRRKFEFSAWLVEEAGKSWQEADADTAEAIDFLEYYGRQIFKLAKGMDVYQYTGELNECFYIPLGVGIVISPWNFPLAILTGMTSAAIVAGNTVVIKPSSQTPIIAAKFTEIWEEAGLPDGVINYLPGSGSTIGDYLVKHPKVRFINFTGSKDVGLRINQLAAELSPGQKWIKRVILEMGGKDAIIVDSEACLEDAADGIVASAFGFQGQKCSACSRAIITADVYDKMVELLVERTKKLKVGPSRTFGINMGPVIDEKAYKNILDYIEIGKAEGKLVIGGNKLSQEGYYIAPTIITDLDPEARVAQEEIFGPVLSVIKARNYDHALEIANGTEYGLTGAVYSKNREKLGKARREFHVGNLYFNRKCTGALVGVQPFGGFNLSGTDSKAGGPDYLQLFMQAKSVAEKL